MEGPALSSDSEKPEPWTPNSPATAKTRFLRLLFTYTIHGDAQQANDVRESALENRAFAPSPLIPNLHGLFPNDPADPNRPRIGKCIYCGASEYQPNSRRPLAEEHPVSEGIGSRYSLDEASCEQCEIRINKFETPVLQKMFHGARERLGIRRKKRKRKQQNYLVSAIVAGKETKVTLSLSDHPTMLCLPTFGAAGIICGRPADMSGIASMWGIALAPHDEMIRRGHLQFSSPVIDTVHFCQYIAKMAHGFAVGELGLSGFTSVLFPKILNDTNVWDDRFLFVGGDYREIAPSDAQHELGWGIFDSGGTNYLVVFVRIFSNLGAPWFHAVVGTLSAAQLEHALAVTEARGYKNDKNPDPSQTVSPMLRLQVEVAPPSKTDAGQVPQSPGPA